MYALLNALLVQCQHYPAIPKGIDQRINGPGLHLRGFNLPHCQILGFNMSMLKTHLPILTDVCLHYFRSAIGRSCQSIYQNRVEITACRHLLHRLAL
jgi:hypothetical protein